MVSKLQRVLKNHLNHFAIKTGVDFFKCVQKLVTQVNAVWLRLDVGASTSDFTRHLLDGYGGFAAATYWLSAKDLRVVLCMID